MFQFPWYASSCLCIQHAGTWLLHHVGFPIRTSPDRCLLTAPRGHIVVRHVLLRLLAPRHPPCALSNLSSRFPRCFVSLSSFQGTMPSVFGGPKRDRTADLLLARQALSQLSYGPS